MTRINRQQSTSAPNTMKRRVSSFPGLHADRDRRSGFTVSISLSSVSTNLRDPSPRACVPETWRMTSPSLPGVDVMTGLTPGPLDLNSLSSAERAFCPAQFAPRVRCLGALLVLCLAFLCCASPARAQALTTANCIENGGTYECSAAVLGIWSLGGGGISVYCTYANPPSADFPWPAVTGGTPDATVEASVQVINQAQNAENAYWPGFGRTLGQNIKL